MLEHGLTRPPEEGL